MGEPTVLVYGSIENESLVSIFQALAARGRRKAVFVVGDQFPTSTGLYLPMDQSGGLLLPPGQDPVPLDDVVSLCLSGFYVSPRGLEEFAPEDQRYIQTESWAALIALFRHLARRCLVANHVTLRDLLANRWAELCYLSSCGLRVPRVLVTSEPREAEAFCQELEGRVLYKPVSSPGPVFRELGEGDRERLGRIAAAPAHFEERSVAPVSRVVVIGGRCEIFPPEPRPGEEILAAVRRACHRLDLHLAEATLRQEEAWVASGLSGFISPETLAEPLVLEAVADLLERGRP